MFLVGEDKGVVESIRDVTGRWGGDFFITDGVRWKRCIQDWKDSGGGVVHLTMYGINLPDVESDLRTKDKILVVVGAEKVPGELYGLADYNVAVTNQPHSEIAGLAVFLDRLFQGRELSGEFPGGKIRVIPSVQGKFAEEV